MLSIRARVGFELHEHSSCVHLRSQVVVSRGSTLSSSKELEHKIVTEVVSSAGITALAQVLQVRERVVLSLTINIGFVVSC